jgi:hypothetical protein
MTESRSCSLCVYLHFVDGKPLCKELPDEHKKSGFPYKNTECEKYYYVLDFAKLYDRTR